MPASVLEFCTWTEEKEIVGMLMLSFGLKDSCASTVAPKMKEETAKTVTATSRRVTVPRRRRRVVLGGSACGVVLFVGAVMADSCVRGAFFGPCSEGIVPRKRGSRNPFYGVRMYVRGTCRSPQDDFTQMVPGRATLLLTPLPPLPPCTTWMLLPSEAHPTKMTACDPMKSELPL